MLRKFAAALAVVLCLANANATRAEPGPVVKWLINEPASLFDIGMSRLATETTRWGRAKEIAELREQLGALIVFWSTYNFPDNRIFLSGLIQDIGDLLADRKAICRKLIDFMSIQALVDPKAGQLMPGVETSGFSIYFQHLGYVNKSAPSNYQSRLDRIFILEALVGDSPQQTICRRSLMSNKVYFEE